MKQRYTNYSHTSTKKESKTLHVNRHKDYPVTAQAGNGMDATVADAGFNPEKEVLTVWSKEGVDDRETQSAGVIRPLNNIQQPDYDTQVIKDITQVKNQFQKTSDAKRGIIGTLLEIVLSIIVLALVVALIILLIVLL